MINSINSIQKQKQGLGAIPITGSTSGQPSSTVLGGKHIGLSNAEVDDEIDSGNQSQSLGAVFTWLSPVNGDESLESKHHWITITPHEMIPVEIISRSLPVHNLEPEIPSSNPTRSSIMIKNDIDGLVFESPISSTRSMSPNYQWDHIQTIPAMSFVMASKRDIRLSCYTEDQTIIFEDSRVSMEDEGKQQIGNMMIYYHSKHSKPIQSDQSVIKLNQTPCGSLIGVIGLRNHHQDHSNGLIMIDYKFLNQTSLFIIHHSNEIMNEKM
ncbi:uncharacterized protein MELLADRAFT_87943 [Melampsora larici-populina 98AG31]|uniref:Uncharacterized protein n=1 Tax=Melampsora larici-populina (strain 98AG31 / pathotype 3-4-7) TaxID=747676 RepID=F4SE22_MELLP|nr:uncharacterized protein MELLADRAFT_87943 [Melampsora larici-populina 98AG31]EGF97105.1 hypothetical protein MELLADRAFT_87943 [Melampsora larici-populina 98AG31]